MPTDAEVSNMKGFVEAMQLFAEIMEKENKFHFKQFDCSCTS